MNREPPIMQDRANRTKLRSQATRAFLALTLSCLAAGCSTPPGELFPPLPHPLVWPASQVQPRIRYVGQLGTSDDLKPAVPAFQRMGNALFGKPAVSSMLTPYAICTDGDRVFVADTNAQTVHRFDLKTRRYGQVKPPGGFSQPVAIACDSNTHRLFVSDSVAKRVQIFDDAGKLLGTIGGDAFVRPAGLAFDERTNRLFVVDVGAHSVLIFEGNGKPLTRFGERGALPGQFNYPTNVTLDSTGRLYVADSLNFRVQQFDSSLKFTRQIGRQGDMPGYFSQPKGLAVDSEDHLYVVDSNFEAIQMFDSEGTLLMDFGSEGHGPGQFWIPSGIHISGNRIFVADGYNRRIQIFDYLPEVRP